MGLQNREHITFSYPESVRFLPTKEASEEKMKRVHDLKQ
jgi:hypothetical protein